MSVPAFSNKFVAGEQKLIPITNKVTSPTGAVSYETKLHLDGYIRRQSHTKNKVRMIQGVPFRSPSTYGRLASVYTYDPGILIRDSKPYVYEGVLGDQNTERGSLRCYVGQTGHTMNFDGSLEGGHIANYQNRADTECLLKLREAKIQLGQFLAESKRSANMVASSMTDLAKLLLDIKHGRINRVVKRLGTPKSVANGLLQVQYGWAPLLTDLHAAYKLCKENTGRGAHMFRVAREIKNTEELHGGNSAYPTMSGTARLSNKTVIYARLSDAFLAQANQIGIVNPLSLGWELVPYSFVVDWMLPIGNYLESLSASAGLTFIGGYRGQRCESTFSATYALSGYHGSGSTVNRDSYHYSRLALTDFPGSSLYVKSPLSTSHVKTALALLTQLI